jgi:molybdopterin-containing oxidoreductase family membrane subunit
MAAPVEGKANKHWWIVFSIALIVPLGDVLFTLCLQELEHGD